MKLSSWIWRGFLGLAVLILLMGPWPAVGAWMGRSAAALAQLGATALSGEHVVVVNALPVEGVASNVNLAVGVPGHSGWTRSFPADLVVFLPIAVLLALFVGTPLAWARRLRCLALGGAAVGLFLILRLSLITLLVWSDHCAGCQAVHPAWLPGPDSTAVLDTLVLGFVSESNVAILVPVVLWLMAMALVGSRPAKSPKSAGPVERSTQRFTDHGGSAPLPSSSTMPGH